MCDKCRAERVRAMTLVLTALSTLSSANVDEGVFISGQMSNALFEVGQKYRALMEGYADDTPEAEENARIEVAYQEMKDALGQLDAGTIGAIGDALIDVRAVCSGTLAALFREVMADKIEAGDPTVPVDIKKSYESAKELGEAVKELAAFLVANPPATIIMPGSPAGVSS